MLRLPRADLVRLAFHEEDEDQGHGGLLSELGVLSSMIRNHHQLFNEDRNSEINNKNLSCLLQSMSKSVSMDTDSVLTRPETGVSMTVLVTVVTVFLCSRP